MSKIYIAGKVTGLDPKECAAKFEKMELQLQAKGWEVVNPVKLINNPGERWASAMRTCLLELTFCDAIFMLPCSTDSRGAKIELQHAIECNIDIYTEIKDLEICKQP
ncbi:DUF4406 domain-containing protein [Flavobacterium sp. N1994]|uniref:DUF4406 domain-containing protein n=1 Tax=Flavobacterium sp. N1994 TaxID=2986827 RepID=UPI0022234FD2|nr:DUF4406 domain-containing protein [Flavobacterium sp. N1994]